MLAKLPKSTNMGQNNKDFASEEMPSSALQSTCLSHTCESGSVARSDIICTYTHMHAHTHIYLFMSYIQWQGKYCLLLWETPDQWLTIIMRQIKPVPSESLPRWSWLSPTPLLASPTWLRAILVHLNLVYDIKGHTPGSRGVVFLWDRIAYFILTF